MENKQRFISQVMTSKELARDCEDVDETVLNFAEIKAVASGNPLIMEKIQTDTEVSRLRVLKSDYERKRYALQDAFMVQYPQKIAAREKELEKIRADIQSRDEAMAKKASFEIQLQGVVFTGHKEAGEVLQSISDSAALYVTKEVGSYKGFRVLLKKDSVDAAVLLQGKGIYAVKIGESAAGNMVRLENLVNGLDKSEEEIQEKLVVYRTEMKNAETEYKKAFPYEGQLKEALKRQLEINTRLEIRDAEERMDETTEKETVGSSVAVFPEIPATAAPSIAAVPAAATLSAAAIPEIPSTAASSIEAALSIAAATPAAAAHMAGVQMKAAARGCM